jgi:hypothetical protein
MSFQDILGKILDSVKSEIKNPENMDKITKDIIQPIVSRVLDEIYPYLMGIVGICMIVILMIIIILWLNIKICYRT